MAPRETENNDYAKFMVNFPNFLHLVCKQYPKLCTSIVFSFSWELKWPKGKLKTKIMQNFGVTNKEHYGMLWYFLEWAITRSMTSECNSANIDDRRYNEV